MILSDKIEFYSFNGELWCKDGIHPDFIIDDTQVDFLYEVAMIIQANYPKAYEALRMYYRKSRINRNFYYYRMVTRFLRCNFSLLDCTYFDIECGRMNFEKVECPFCKDCKLKNIVCSPEYDTVLSPQENRIGKLWYLGMSKTEIGDKLCLSRETVNTHLRNMYRKLNIHEKAEFVKYADSNKLYQ